MSYLSQAGRIIIRYLISSPLLMPVTMLPHAAACLMPRENYSQFSRIVRWSSADSYNGSGMYLAVTLQDTSRGNGFASYS
jgi:hypothetical protein